MDDQECNGGNFITSNETYTLSTAAQEGGGAINKLDSANVGAKNRVWFMNPRSKNYLYNVQNTIGVYVFRDEMMTGTQSHRSNRSAASFHSSRSRSTSASRAAVARQVPRARFW